mgnify:CR=1 FL=1
MALKYNRIIDIVTKISLLYKLTTNDDLNIIRIQKPFKYKNGYTL